MARRLPHVRLLRFVPGKRPYFGTGVDLCMAPVLHASMHGSCTACMHAWHLFCMHPCMALVQPACMDGASTAYIHAWRLYWLHACMAPVQPACAHGLCAAWLTRITACIRCNYLCKRSNVHTMQVSYVLFWCILFCLMHALAVYACLTGFIIG